MVSFMKNKVANTSSMDDMVVEMGSKHCLPMELLALTALDLGVVAGWEVCSMFGSASAQIQCLELGSARLPRVVDTVMY